MTEHVVPPAPPPAAPPAPAPAPPQNPSPVPTSPPPATPPGSPPPAPAEINDPVALKAALAAERRAREVAEAESRRIASEHDRLRQASMTEQEKLVETARREATTAATKSFEKRMFAAEVRVAVAGRVVDPSFFSDPEVALHLFGLSEVPTKNGDIDKEAIKTAVDAFLRDRPWFAAGAGAVSPAPQFGNADGGTRPSVAEPDLSKMSYEDYQKWAEENDPRTRRRRAAAS